MTTLRDGTVVDESINAVHYTRPEDCPGVFSGYSRNITSITIHHWGPLGQDFDQVVGYLASDNPRMSSAHAVVMAGRAASIVSSINAAWHAGNARGNATSYGIECRPEATDADYTTVAAYVAYIRSIVGDVPLVPHNSWISTECPGVWDLARLDTLARNIGEIDMPLSQDDIDKVASAVLGKVVGSGDTQNSLEWFLEAQRQGRKEDVTAICNVVVNSISKIPQITPEIVAQLKADLASTLSNISVTLTAKR